MPLGLALESHNTFAWFTVFCCFVLTALHILICAECKPLVWQFKVDQHVFAKIIIKHCECGFHSSLFSIISFFFFIKGGVPQACLGDYSIPQLSPGFFLLYHLHLVDCWLYLVLHLAQSVNQLDKECLPGRLCPDLFQILS